MKPHKILIAVPMMSTVCSEFFTSMMAIQTGGYQCQLGVEMNSLVYEARNRLVLQAIDNKCDYIMWFDSDMVIPPDTLVRLVHWAEEGYDMVSGLYFARRLPTKPIIAKKLIYEQNMETGEITHGAEMYYDYPRNDFFEIAACGFGCVLTRTSMNLEASEKYMHSPFDPLPSLGEDYSFCYRLSQMGKKIYCDSSVKCGHVGKITFSERTYEQQQEAGEEDGE